MAESLQLQIGRATLTRVLYFDVALEPDAVGLTEAQLTAQAWAVPTWIDAAQKVRIGQAVWVVQADGETFVIDPCGASDPFLRTGREAITHQTAVFSALRSAGIELDAVDAVVLSHLDGIGMAAAVTDAGDFVPAFPKARVLVSAAESAFIDVHADEISGARAFEALRKHGVVDRVELPHRINATLELVAAAGHTPGHCALWIRSDGEHAVFIGHLAVSPIHAAVGLCPSLHVDAQQAAESLAKILKDAAALNAVVIGPLWPTPGAARVTQEASQGWRLVALTDTLMRVLPPALQACSE